MVPIHYEKLLLPVYYYSRIITSIMMKTVDRKNTSTTMSYEIRN